MGPWRLLLDGDGHGFWNMGVDEELVATAARGGPATLRLYGWRGPWLSLGYAQHRSFERAGACRAAGAGVVRRATGGRAVLHGADLTYAVAAPEAALPEGLRATYALLAGALAEALAALGVAAERAPAGPAEGAGFDCFAAPAGDELCVGGRKLVGSAQLRAGGAVLQHGSLRLAPDPLAVRQAVGLPGSGATSLVETGCVVAPERLRALLVEAFEAALGATLQPGSLSASERDRARCRKESPRPRAAARAVEGPQAVSGLADT